MDDYARPDTQPDRPPDALWLGDVPVWYGPMHQVTNPETGKATMWFRWVYVGKEGE